jgi:hypothetical protein
MLRIAVALGAIVCFNQLAQTSSAQAEVFQVTMSPKLVKATKVNCQKPDEFELRYEIKGTSMTLRSERRKLRKRKAVFNITTLDPKTLVAHQLRTIVNLEQSTVRITETAISLTSKGSCRYVYEAKI